METMLSVLVIYILWVGVGYLWINFTSKRKLLSAFDIVLLLPLITLAFIGGLIVTLLHWIFEV